MNEPVLFSSCFEQVYGLLGIFSVRYIAGRRQGLSRESVVRDCGLTLSQAESALELLIAGGLVSEDSQQGVLHLQEQHFYRSSVWDLLALCEPWLLSGGQEEFAQGGETQLMRSTRLYEVYLEDLRELEKQ